MLDINYIRQNPEEVVTMLHKRQLASEEPKINELLKLEDQRKTLVRESDDLKALRNKRSKEIADMKRRGISGLDLEAQIT